MGKLTNKFSAIILAAGIGKRIENLTNKPKCLLKYKNKTILEQTISDLINLNISSVYIAVGFKKNLIKKKLIIFKNKIDIKYINVDNYNINGSSYSWKKIEKIWSQKKNNIIFLHADLVYDFKLLKNIIFSKKKNIIGVVKRKNYKIKTERFVVNIDDQENVKSILKKKKVEKNGLELACINKLSVRNQKLFFDFLEEYLFKYSKKHTWEIPLNILIKNKKIKFKINKPEYYFLHNINTKADYIELKLKQSA